MKASSQTVPDYIDIGMIWYDFKVKYDIIQYKRKNMIKFIYNGVYYPVIGSSSLFENGKYKCVVSRKLGGYGDSYREWLPNYGIKCRLWNPDKPYKQEVIDAIERHPDMVLDKWYFDDEHKDRGFMWYVKTKKGKSVGTIQDAYFISDLVDLKTHREDSNQVCAGWSEKEQLAYGWSHRAKVGFGIGNKIFEEGFGDENTPYISHSTRTIHTKEHAMESAIAFANSVS